MYLVYIDLLISWFEMFYIRFTDLAFNCWPVLVDLAHKVGEMPRVPDFIDCQWIVLFYSTDKL